MRISDWSSDVCSSDLEPPRVPANADVTVSMGASGLSMLSIDTSSGRQTIFQSLMEFKDALDNPPLTPADQPAFQARMDKALAALSAGELGRASCGEQVCKYVSLAGVAVSFTKQKTT